MVQTEFIEVAKVNEIPDGKMKHFEVDGKMWSHECPTFNGQFGGTTVTCPFHGSNFDVVTGKKLTEPILTPPQGMEPLPQTWQKYLEHAGKLMAHIKTYDQTTL